jgi:agmatinase
MKFIQVPAINGLKNTVGTEKAPEIICKDLESIRLEINNEDIEKQQKQIEEQTTKDFSDKPVFIGGDHSISYPLTKNFLKKYPEGEIIILDAHPDLMIPMQEPTHEEWLRKIIDDEKIAPEKITLIGIRKNSENVDQRELDIIKEKGIKEIYKPSKNPTYLSIDIDYFDSSVVEATGYPEKDGPLEEEGLSMIRNIIKNSSIKAIDLVEFNPTKKNPEKTLKLIKKILEILKNES